VYCANIWPPGGIAGLSSIKGMAVSFDLPHTPP
jgi:hypothetical protein